MNYLENKKAAKKKKNKLFKRLNKKKNQDKIKLFKREKRIINRDLIKSPKKTNKRILYKNNINITKDIIKFIILVINAIVFI